MNCTPEDIKRVKGLGCLQNTQTGNFNVRVVTGNGKVSSRELETIAEAAARFGSGEVSLTTRLSMEIQSVPFENLEPLFAFLAEHGLETGGTGARVRPVVSCKGTTCIYGLIDTYRLSRLIHEQFYQGFHDMILPHKFKIAVGGCPNNCIKPNLNDIGIVGQKIPAVDTNLCRGCKSCKIEKTCPTHAAEVIDGILQIDDSLCLRCGRCVKTCPFDAVSEAGVGYKVYLGGRWGKKTAEGRALSLMFSSEEEVLLVIEQGILLFKNEGVAGERFSETIERLGFEYVEEKMLSAPLLSHSKRTH